MRQRSTGHAVRMCTHAPVCSPDCRIIWCLPRGCIRSRSQQGRLHAVHEYSPVVVWQLRCMACASHGVCSIATGARRDGRRLCRQAEHSMWHLPAERRRCFAPRPESWQRPTLSCLVSARHSSVAPSQIGERSRSLVRSAVVVGAFLPPARSVDYLGTHPLTQGILSPPKYP
jgi:hypothetical protein